MVVSGENSQDYDHKWIKKVMDMIEYTEETFKMLSNPPPPNPLPLYVMHELKAANSRYHSKLGLGPNHRQTIANSGWYGYSDFR
jgi:hypothetical protein